MTAPDERVWKEDVRSHIAEAPRPLHFFGVGNELRGDDGTGPFAASLLRSRLGRRRPRWVVVHGQESPERAFTRVPQGHGVALFDAVQSRGRPGRIVCTTLADTRYGFFATHNVPLRLLPGLSERADKVIVMGVEPESLEVGEGLSGAVRASIGALVEEVAGLVSSP